MQQITINLTEDEKKKLEEAADIELRDVDNFIRYYSVKAANEIEPFSYLENQDLEEDDEESDDE